MRLPTREAASLSLVLALALTLPTTEAAAGPEPRYDGGRTDCARHGQVHVFPLLRWLRDTAVEAVFGKSSMKTKDTKSTQSDSDVHTRYLNDIVVRFNVTNSAEEAALAKATKQMFLDVWAFTPEYVDIRIYKDYLPSVLTLLPSSLQPFVLIPDVQAAVSRTFPSEVAGNSEFDLALTDKSKIFSSFDGMSNLFFRQYQTLSTITSWMRLLEAMFPTITEMTSIGKSYEGRDVYALRVGARTEDDQTDKPRKTILVTGGLHGREWISTSTVTYLMWSFITTYAREPMITKILQHFDIIFIPVLNPDGYEYTWRTDRLWRKSRQQTKLRFCRGLDLDHAFGYEWESANLHADPCSDSYGGDSPFQAVEASELAKWARNQTESGVKFVGFLDLHSYSQQVLFPYAYTCSVDPPNLENLEELAVGLAKAIRLSSGQSYGVASACEGAVDRSRRASDSLTRVEAGGGSAIDWFYHELQARYSYQIKLRDTGSYGFLLPSENIVPAGEEILNALKYFGDFLLGNNGIEKPFFELADDGWRDLKRRKT
ncbi:putative metallocarboxypeptidase ecm14 [Cladorrhinum samala]|uniref:Inactive metallocarboxypeptidase ECM14 n=1 Tax=Cladorrhinum samala TaxID=585594 RepID=A0AAV9HJ69_9PEZI|nr:putative metallocarboxypeptidase ecm14 [Cladorrhinum samala]